MRLPSNLSKILLLSAIFPSVSQAATVNFLDFSDISKLQLNGNALKINNGSQDVLRLTSEAFFQSGSAFLKTATSLASDASFSAAFSFKISVPTFGVGDGDGRGADGIAFVVQTVANNVGGAGGGIGYQGIPHSVGIEFDTFFNGSGAGDPDGNHVAVDINGSLSSPLAVHSVAQRLNDNTVKYVWVDYNGATDNLEVRINDTSSRPLNPIITQTVDLTSVLTQTDAFIGFTSGTGGGVGNHDILSFAFNDSFKPIQDPTVNPVPEASNMAGSLLLGGLTAAGWLRRRKS